MCEIASTEQRKYTAYWSHQIGRIKSPGMDAVEEFIEEASARQVRRVLDLGCGGGWPAQRMLEHGFDVVPFDIATNALDYCTEQAVSVELRSRFVQGCAWDLPFKADDFDCVFCTDVLEHLPTEQLGKVMSEMARIAKLTYCEWADFQDEGGSKMVDEPLHLTLQPLDWWIFKLQGYWYIVEAGTRGRMGSMPIMNHRERRLTGGWAWLER